MKLRCVNVRSNRIELSERYRIVRRVESSGQTEVTSQQVGELVMDALSQLDQVAYIRYASVWGFREPHFGFVEGLNEPDEEELNDRFMSGDRACSARSRNVAPPLGRLRSCQDGHVIGRQLDPVARPLPAELLQTGKSRRR